MDSVKNRADRMNKQTSSNPIVKPKRQLPIPSRGKAEQPEQEDNGHQPEPLSLIVSPGKAKAPSELTNVQLLRDPGTLTAGLKLMNAMMSQELAPKAVRAKLGVPLKKKKTWEADTSLESCRRSKRAKKPVESDSSNLITKSRKKKAQVQKTKTDETDHRDGGEDEDDDLADLAHQQNERGDALFKEFIKRTTSASAYSSKPRDYEAQKIQLDAMLSDKSAFSDLDPLYEEKKEVFDGRAEKIKVMSVRKLKRKFKRISPELTEIVDGNVECERRELYMSKNMRKLKELNTCKPFDNNHGAALFALLYDLIVEDETERPMWTQFINFVMLPETFIRIYALVNHISYDSASAEMLFGPLYEGPVRHN